MANPIAKAPAAGDIGQVGSCAGQDVLQPNVSPAADTYRLSGLTRPRYYSGQYLTDEELDLEQDYFREKLRRHNLYLHGVGVVAGLEVTCGPQDGYVTLAPGYAIDGCGNDIYVPTPSPYNLIANLPPAVDRCTDPNEFTRLQGGTCQVYLYLHYQEAPGDLRRAVPPGACTGNGHCEPGRIFEGFSLRLTDQDERRPAPDLVDALAACARDTLAKSGIVQASREVLKVVEAAQAWDQGVHDQLVAQFATLRTNLLAVTATGQISCAVHPALLAQTYPEFTPGDPDYPEKALNAFARLYDCAINTAWDCASEALLIRPAACHSGDSADVLLAEITVRNQAIVKICNHARRHVKSFPAFSYWLSPLSRALVAPFNALLRKSKNPRELRGLPDLLEWASCEFDFNFVSRRLVSSLLPRLKNTPQDIQPYVAGARNAIKYANTQSSRLNTRYVDAREQLRKRLPDITKRLNTVVMIQKQDPLQVTDRVKTGTGLPVAGTSRIDNKELLSVANLRATAGALLSDKPVEVVTTTGGFVFLRTRIDAGTVVQPGGGTIVQPEGGGGTVVQPGGGGGTVVQPGGGGTVVQPGGGIIVQPEGGGGTVVQPGSGGGTVVQPGGGGGVVVHPGGGGGTLLHPSTPGGPEPVQPGETGVPAAPAPAGAQPETGAEGASVAPPDLAAIREEIARMEQQLADLRRRLGGTA